MIACELHNSRPILEAIFFIIVKEEWVHQLRIQHNIICKQSNILIVAIKKLNLKEEKNT
jgi:hypothetical protein